MGVATSKTCDRNFSCCCQCHGGRFSLYESANRRLSYSCRGECYCDQFYRKLH